MSSAAEGLESGAPGKLAPRGAAAAAAAAPSPFEGAPATPQGQQHPGPAAAAAAAAAAARSAAAAGIAAARATTAALRHTGGGAVLHSGAGTAAGPEIEPAAAAHAAHGDQGRSPFGEESDGEELSTEEEEEEEGEGGRAGAAAGGGTAAGMPAAVPQQRRRGHRRRLWRGLGPRHASDAGLLGLAEAAGHALVALRWPRLGLSGRQALISRPSMATRLAAGLVLALTVGYVLLLAPRAFSPRTEAALLLRAWGDNGLAFVLFNLLGLLPALLSAVMWPSLRSKGDKVSLSTHLNWSFFTGSFALLAYLARWSPPATGTHPLGGPAAACPRAGSQPERSPAARGRRPAAAAAAAASAAQSASAPAPWPHSLLHTRAAIGLVTAAIAALLALAAAATPATWAHFGFLATHSWVLHVMVLDLALLNVLAPALVVADARAQGLGFARTAAGCAALGAAMLALPMVGPGLYLLLLQPCRQASGSVRTGTGGSSRSSRRRRSSWLPAGLAHLWPGALSGSHPARATCGGAGQANTAADAVAAAAAVPLPSGQEADAAAGRAAAGFGWSVLSRLRHGLLWVLTGGYPHYATATRTGSLDEVFMDYHEGADAIMAAANGHTGPPGAAPGSPEGDAITAAAAARRDVFQHHPALGPSARFTPAVMPGGGCKLLFAEGYDEQEAPLEEDSEDEDGGGDDAIMTDDDGSLFDDEDEDDEDEDEDEEGEEEGPGKGVAAAAAPGGVLRRVGVAAGGGRHADAGGADAARVAAAAPGPGRQAGSGLHVVDDDDTDGGDGFDEEDDDEEEGPGLFGRGEELVGEGGGDGDGEGEEGEGEEEGGVSSEGGNEGGGGVSGDRPAKLAALQRLHELSQAAHPRHPV